MMNKATNVLKVECYNPSTNKAFVLPTDYIDRVEACVCGQNYCRDRQREDGTILFFRVIDSTTSNYEPHLTPENDIAFEMLMATIDFIDQHCVVMPEDEAVCPEEITSCFDCPNKRKCHN